MVKLPLLRLALGVSVLSFFSVELCAGDNDYIKDLTQDDPFYYTSDQAVTDHDGQKLLVGSGRPSKSHSQVPHLPAYYGYMSTNYTYRFVNVVEQTLTMIGEGKHGLWRVQDNGTIREYRKKGAKGLPENADLFAKKNLSTIVNEYSHYLPEESWDGYKHPHDKISEDGRLNFVDLPINHPKYAGKYADHVPIDLPHWYCTMSANRYPYAKKALDFAFKQPGANGVGPLGRRAGLDVNELYTNVIRLQLFPDARAWVNVGNGDGDKLHVNWQAIDLNKTEAEFYLVERPFFNEPYLFIAAVFDNPDNTDFRYVRPSGDYYEHLKSRKQKVNTTVTQSPRFYLETSGAPKEAIGLPIYGVHHPNRDAYGGGGACPLKGGDWSNYPDTAGGAAWPTNYEEVTPLCDAVLVDIKFYSNLDGSDWSSPAKYLGNAGYGTKKVTYKMQPGEYGVFTDPYNTERNVKNPDAEDLPGEVTLKYPTVPDAVTYTPE